MPHIVHDGARRWRELNATYGRDASALSAPQRADFLASYLDDVPDDHGVFGKSGWIEAAQRLAEHSETDDAIKLTSEDVTASIRFAAERDRGLSAAVPPKQTIFVSHRQTDRREAIDLANQILAHGKFDVWLDIWDPRLAMINKLRLNRTQKSLLTAMVIEIGLVNATGLVALISQQTRGSAWIPYEYGRVRTGGPYANSAAIYRHKRTSYEAYMDLGAIIDHNSGSNIANLRAWLNAL